MEWFDRAVSFGTGAGFSVLVSFWFMMKHDKRLEELTRALVDLRLFLAAQQRKGGSDGSD